MTRTLAGELAPYNIRVNDYASGVVETDMTKKHLKKTEIELKNQILLFFSIRIRISHNRHKPKSIRWEILCSKS